jgi:hypothetical protein
VTGRERCRAVLDAELRNWTSLTAAELAAALTEERHYEVERDSFDYQVEVQLLEETPACLHVLISVDDGSLRIACSPESADFIVEKGK